MAGRPPSPPKSSATSLNEKEYWLHFRRLHELLAPSGHNISETIDKEWIIGDHERQVIGSTYMKMERKWETMPQRKDMHDALARQREAVLTVESEYCFGLGSLVSPVHSGDEKTLEGRLLQLVTMIDRVKYMNEQHGSSGHKVQMFAQDPEFKQEDLTFLKYLHIQPSSRTMHHQDMFPRMQSNSSFYAPNLPWDVDVHDLFSKPERPVMLFTQFGTLDENAMYHHLAPDMESEGPFRHYWAMHQREHAEPILEHYELEIMRSWIPYSSIRRKPGPWTVEDLVFEDMAFWIRKDKFARPKKEQQQMPRPSDTQQTVQQAQPAAQPSARRPSQRSIEQISQQSTQLSSQQSGQQPRQCGMGNVRSQLTRIFRRVFKRRNRLRQ